MRGGWLKAGRAEFVRSISPVLVQSILESIDGGGLDDFLGETVPVFKYSFREEFVAMAVVFPNEMLMFC